MKAHYYALALGMLAGVAIGGFAVQGLHAQGAKTKTAYSVSELTILSREAERAYVVEARKVIGGNQGKPLRTSGGRVEKIEGGEPPTSAAIVEWPSIEAAQKFYKSDAWTKLQPQRDKAYKLIRRYVVETE
jgi:uncharacterized protein (DUF1330 family)